MEQRKQIVRRICVCDKCKGTGQYIRYALNDVRMMQPIREVCRQCNGSGRVEISGVIIKQVEPYVPPTD